MTRTIALAALVTLAFDHGHCQDLPKAATFEVASITPSKQGTPEPPGEHAGMVQFTYPGGRFQANATTLKFLLEWAYDIQPSQHSDGPAWVGSDRYDVVAKAEGNASDAQIKLMVRALLADRFKLKLRHDSKDMSVYVVSLGKNQPKLFPPKDGEVHSIQIAPLTGSDPKLVSYHVVATRFSLTQLTDTFARQLGRVMLNKTGLDGDYDFTLDLAPDETRPSPLDPAILITAMQQQLGLTLKTEKTAVDYLVIDNAEKVLAGN